MRRNLVPKGILTGAFFGLMALPVWSQVQPGTQPVVSEPAVSQPVVSQPAAQSGKCARSASMAAPATPDDASADGTAPSNSGSTGWSGGTGGSNIGTNPSGATPHSKTWHAPTARGLDLKGRAEPVAAC